MAPILARSGDGRLEVVDHQGAHVLQRVLFPGEARRLAAQHRPAPRLQHDLQVREVGVDRLHVRIATAEHRLEIAVGAAELAVEPRVHGLGDELRRMAQHVESGTVRDVQHALIAARDGDAAKHELRVQAVAALLEITAVGHLGDHVRGADQVPDLAIAGVVEADLVELELIAGEMHDLRGHRHPLRHADRRQVARKEARAAADVRARELGAVAMLRVVGLADVACIVEQRDHYAHHGPVGAEALVRCMRLVVAGEQPRHRERVVQRVLQIVIDGVAAEVTGELPGEQALEVAEGCGDAFDVSARPGLRDDFLNRPAHGARPS